MQHLLSAVLNPKVSLNANNATIFTNRKGRIDLKKPSAKGLHST